jgi:hypothetical protein
MIVYIIKFIVSIFLFIVSIILFVLWLFLGSIFLIAMIIRLISLYTIALLNSFVSGNPLTHDYVKAIEDIIDMYLKTYVKIFTMCKLPWLNVNIIEKSNLRSLLSTEIHELKKSWAITLIVFVSYTASFGVSLAVIAHKDNDELKHAYELKIERIQEDLNKAELQNDEFDKTITKLTNQRIRLVSDLYRRNYTIKEIALYMYTTPAEIQEFIDNNNINR